MASTRRGIVLVGLSSVASGFWAARPLPRSPTRLFFDQGEGGRGHEHHRRHDSRRLVSILLLATAEVGREGRRLVAEHRRRRILLSGFHSLGRDSLLSRGRELSDASAADKKVLRVGGDGRDERPGRKRAKVGIELGDELPKQLGILLVEIEPAHGD